MRKILSILMAAVLVVHLCGCGKAQSHEENKMKDVSEESGYTGAPVYIHKLCPGSDDFWFIRQEYTDEGFVGHLYRIDKDGQEEYVRKLPISGGGAWNREKERFYYISENMLNEYDPKTGETACFELSDEYDHVSYSFDDIVFLHNSTSKNSIFSLESYDAVPYDGSRYVIDASGNCFLTVGYSDDSISCYETETGSLLWKSAPFTVRTSVDACISGDKVYMSSDNSSGVFARALNGDEDTAMTEIQTRTHAVADGGEYVVCAVRAYKSIEFKALYHDGRVEDIAVWDGVNFFLVGSVLLEVWNGKLYCTLTTEEGLFTCELP